MTTQTWNSQTYATNARFVAELEMPVIEPLNLQPGDRILDLGCGQAEQVIDSAVDRDQCEAIVKIKPILESTLSETQHHK